MITTYGPSLRKCGDGSNGTMVAMFCWLTKLRLDGITFQTEVLTQKQTLDKVSLIPNTFIITTSTRMPMRNLEPKEVLLEPVLVVSYPEVNSMMKADGDHILSETLLI